MIFLRTETRRGAGVVVIIACTILPCPPYSVLSESNECNDLIAGALACGEIQTWGYVQSTRVHSRATTGCLRFVRMLRMLA